MAEQVTASPIPDLGLAGVGLDQLEAVLLDPGERTLPDGNHPVLLALAVSDHHRAALVADVVDGSSASSLRRMAVE